MAMKKKRMKIEDIVQTEIKKINKKNHISIVSDLYQTFMYVVQKQEKQR